MYMYQLCAITTLINLSFVRYIFINNGQRRRKKKLVLKINFMKNLQTKKIKKLEMLIYMYKISENSYTIWFCQIVSTTMIKN